MLEAAAGTGENASGGAPGDVAITMPPADMPERIGPFEIIEELGRGGMGRVFAARQTGLGRIVALKAIAAGRNTADLELRFLREAQMAARLRHPHIVAVHDSGRADGFVYFAMDYIEGGDLARRLRARPLAPRAAAVLLHKLALALAYTHGEGVLHRDLKPSNILLEGDEPRLADFGLAAQLEAGGDLTARTSVLGTPHYLAPEALRHGSAALSVASDLYALGVILFELLTGRTPFAGASPAELAAMLETTEPPSPRLLAPAVPRDLETICLVCLEREPARRYADAAALAEDLRRFLADEPIRAKPPGAWERFRKFSRRHRAEVVAAGVVAAVLLGATAVSAALAVRARRAGRQAEVEARTSRALADFLQHDLLAQASPEKQPDRDLKLRTVLDRAAARIDGRFAGQPLVEAALRVSLAETYEGLGEYAAATPQLERALALRRRELGPRAPDTLRVMAGLTMARYHAGQYKEAEALGAEVLAAQREVLGPEHPDTLESASTLALARQNAGHLPEAEALYRETLAARRRVLGSDHTATLETATGLGVTLRLRGQLAEAEPLLREVLAARRRVDGAENPGTLRAMSELAAVLTTNGHHAEAETLFTELVALNRRVVGPEAPDTLTAMSNLAVTYGNQGKFAEAAAVFDEVLPLARRVRGPEHPNTLNILLSRALNLTQLEDFAGAEAAFAECVPILQRALGPQHLYTLAAMLNRASNYEASGRAAEAGALIAETIEAAQRALGPEHFLTLAARHVAADVALERGQLDAAAAAFTAVWQARCRVLGAGHSSTLLSQHMIAVVERRQGKLAAALAREREVLAARRAKFSATHPGTLLALEAVGGLLVQTGEFAAAEPLLREAWQARTAIAPTQWHRWAVQSELGAALAGRQRFAEAEPLLVAACEALRAQAERVPLPQRACISEAGTRVVQLYAAWQKAAEAEAWRAKLAARE